MSPGNPRKWRYTWEAQSHLPILKLFLFSPEINPISHCNDLNVDLKLETSLLNLTWKDPNSPNPVSLVVPLPRVLVDLDSPVNFRVLDDHIEVKIALLLSVDHPIVSSFISELNSGDENGPCCSSELYLEPLSMESDFKTLSSKGEVDFFCRNCSFKLTKTPIRCLVDLPSVNWTDVADNWFGGCCCSFGGISEKLVAKYVKSYRCVEGTCLLTTASVILCKNDVTRFKSPEMDRFRKSNDSRSFNITCNTNNDVDACVSRSSVKTLTLDSSAKVAPLKHQEQSNSVNGICTEPDDHSGKKSTCTLSAPDVSRDAASEHNCCTHNAPESSLKDQAISASVILQADQKSFLNCYLGNAFLFRSSGLSKDIEWTSFTCPKCSFILGAFPCADGSEPLDGGIRLLKCCISISPSSDLSDDLFSKYTLERMFTFQLLESAKDELTFRTVVKDLKTKSPMLHIVLVNPNSWCCTGYCSEGTAEQLVKINLHPVAKALLSHCDDAKSELRLSQEWETKNQADEIYMLTDVIRELIKSVERANDMFPPSFSSSQTFLLCSLLR